MACQKRPSRRRILARLKLGRWVPMRHLIGYDLDWSIHEPHYDFDWEQESVRRRAGSWLPRV